MALRERDELIVNPVDRAAEQRMRTEVELGTEARDTGGGACEVIAQKVRPALGSCA